MAVGVEGAASSPSLAAVRSDRSPPASSPDRAAVAQRSGAAVAFRRRMDREDHACGTWRAGASRSADRWPATGRGMVVGVAMGGSGPGRRHTRPELDCCPTKTPDFAARRQCGQGVERMEVARIRISAAPRPADTSAAPPLWVLRIDAQHERRAVHRVLGELLHELRNFGAEERALRVVCVAGRRCPVTTLILRSSS